MLDTATGRRYSKTTAQYILRSAMAVLRQTDSAQQRKINQTEESASAQLPGDLFQFDSRFLNRAASFGLIPMEEGWIAGGVIAKIALARIRSQPPAQSSSDLSGDTPDWAKEINAVYPSMSARSLLRLRADLVRRGLIR